MGNKYSEILSITDINDGIVDKLFKAAMRKVRENLADDTVVSLARRDIDIRISIKPVTHEREHAEITVSSNVKLARPKGSSRTIVLSTDGENVKLLNLDDDPAQGELGDEDGNIVEMDVAEG